MAAPKAGRMTSVVKLFIIALACALVLGLAACAPQSIDSTSENSSLAESDEIDRGSFVDAADFTERSTGLYPDVQKNDRYQNSGNRGCAACHGDLFDLDKDNGTTTHITTYVGLKDATYSGDCFVCHELEEGAAGNLMSENMHVLHYSSPTFNEANGNCWSCHVTVTNPETQEAELKLFEEVQYEAAYGGYGLSPLTEATQTWSSKRGWETGFLSGVTTVADPKLTIDIDQAPNAEEDEFLIMNYRRVDENDEYATIDPATWTLDVQGVKNPAKLSLDDLKAMPQTEITGAQWCFVAGTNSAMVDNRPMKGVLLEDLINELGGLTGDYNAATFNAVDPWDKGQFTDLAAYLEAGAMIVVENYGHDLTLEQGGPACLFLPGSGGNVDVKWLTQIVFSQSEKTLNISDFMDTFYFPMGWSIDINTTWFDNGGVEGKVGETMQLEGASVGWTFSHSNHEIDKILFSFDYGQNWVECVAPDNFDPTQWAHFTLNWTPEQAGTYVVKAKAVDTSGIEQDIVSNLLVTVSE